MRSLFNVDSTVTTRRLVKVRKNYFIHLEYELHVPLSGERPYNAFPCGFNLSIDVLEARLKFPLHHVIEACLEQWRISPSQIVPNLWRYLVAFLWECYVSGISATRELIMACFRLSRGQAKYYLVARNEFHVSGALSSNKRWKSHFLSRGLELPDRVDLSDGEQLCTGDVGVSMTEKRPSSGAGVGLRKRLWKMAAEQPANTSGSTARTSANKGKEMVEPEEVPEWGYTMRELCEVEDRVGADKYFTSIMTRLKCVDSEDPLVPRWSTISGSSPFWIEGPLSGEYLRGALHPTLAKQVYECTSEELMNRASKSAVWVRNVSFLRLLFSFQTLTPLCLQGLHFISALIDRVHDAGRLVRSQHEKILTLRAVNKELKAGVGQDLVAAAEWRAKELESEIEKMRTKMESLRSQRRELELEVGLLRSSLDGARNDRARLEGDVLSLTETITFLEAKLKAEGQKAVATYKASREFESGLEKMGRVSYEFGYRVALERLRGKHPDIIIERDPFAECSEDANVEMDLDQPFNDGTTYENQPTL
ncbi:hypothetical protein GW17_00058299 [Ensete ventricosum]|nr:hypothetical protein GW17_00058299 [Ensete ventricosum]